MRKLGFKLFFAAVMAVSMTSCDSCGGGGEDDLCDHDKLGYSYFKSDLEKQSTLQLIDYRSEADFKAGHIPGAVNLPVSNKMLDGTKGDCEYVDKALELFDPNIPLFVYGGDSGFGIYGNSVPGQLACKFTAGVSLLDGGYKKWVDNGGATE